jgi:hypothetical protein
MKAPGPRPGLLPLASLKLPGQHDIEQLRAGARLLHVAHGALAAIDDAGFCDLGQVDGIVL